MLSCSNCNTHLTENARFCSNCGQPQLAALKAAPKDMFDWKGNLVQQANERMRKRLIDRVKAEQDEKKIAAYQERIYESGYRELLQRRFEQWTDYASLAEEDVERLKFLEELKQLIDDLLDFFFVIHCADLNKILINESVLQYQNVDLSSIDTSQLALDFLDFQMEEERIYTDFISLPVKKLKNASQQFLFPEKDERIWFICDQSLLGNGKEGFAMTEKALYWRSGLQGAQRVYYHKIVSLKKEKEWLLINDLYFNATASINTKMIWLLRKLANFY